MIMNYLNYPVLDICQFWHLHAQMSYPKFHSWIFVLLVLLIALVTYWKEIEIKYIIIYYHNWQREIIWLCH